MSKQLYILFFMCYLTLSMQAQVDQIPCWKKNSQKYIEAAEKAGAWLVDNQVTDTRDANYGRFLLFCNINTGEHALSTNWGNGSGILSLCYLYRYTGDKIYLDAAKRAASYILSLQVLDPDKLQFYGGIREITPQTGWMTTRDATTAAWGLLGLYQITGDHELLKAVMRFADWQLEYAWQLGWPRRIVRLNPWLGSNKGIKPEWVIQNSAQAGAAGFFLDLTMETGIVRYAEQGARRLLNYYIKHFLEPSGQLHILYDPIAGNWEVDKPGERLFGGSIPTGWFNMHRFNDDFAALGLLRGYQILHDDRYLEAVKAYARWVVKNQLENGGFGNPEVEAAASCVPLILMELRTITGDKKNDRAIEQALDRLLKLQQENDNKMIDGGFLCLDNHHESDPGNWVNIRNTTYSIMALIKATSISSGPGRVVWGLNPSGIKQHDVSGISITNEAN